MKPVDIKYGRKTITVKPTIVDQLVNFFDPVAGNRRFQARMQMAMVGGYTGARKDRKQTKTWNPAEGDADSVIIPDLPTLRDRSRDLERNSPLAGGAIATKVTSVVGTGLKPRASIDRDILKGLSDEQADAWEMSAMREFNLAVGNDDWDVEGHHNFYLSQDLVLRSTLSAGDMLVNLPRIRRPGNPYTIRANFIEADRICNENFAADTETKIAGVSKDKYGAPESFDVASFYPGNWKVKNRKWKKINYRDENGRRLAIFLLRKRRAGQTRGVPDLAPVVEMLKSISDYTDNELHASVVASLFTVFVKSRDPESVLVDQDYQESKDTERIDAKDIKLGSGSVVGLWPDEDITIANPGRPNAAAEVFLRAMAEQIGVALELPYEILVKHFTASYSAAQAALLEAWRFFMTCRTWLADKYCQPIWEEVITESIAMGRLPAPGFFSDPLIRQAYLGCEWVGDARGQIDEVKAVEAAKAREDAGYSTKAEETTKLTGGNWERNHRQQVKEKNARKRDGLIEDLEPPKQPGSKPATVENDQDESDLEEAAA